MFGLDFEGNKNPVTVKDGTLVVLVTCWGEELCK